MLLTLGGASLFARDKDEAAVKRAGLSDASDFSVLLLGSDSEGDVLLRGSGVTSVVLRACV